MGKKIGIGLLGCGTVGRGVVRILTENAYHIAQRVGAEPVIRRILVRDPQRARGLEIDPSLFTTDASEILDDPGIEIVVEVMGGIQPALDYMKEAIRRGKSVVTANKDVIAVYGHDLLLAAEEMGVDLYFEGSVAGGIPIIRPLKHCLAANRIREIIGIVNGTTNYMLTRMSQMGVGYEEALREAQAKGYAEADPSADVEGWDAARKLAILASIAFNTRITVEQVYVEGITRITARDITYARELNYVIKLLAVARDTERGVEVRVHPALLPLEHPLAAVSGVYNAVFVRGDAVGDVMFFGRGAGELPTASAVTADIMDAVRNRLRSGRDTVGCTCYEERTVRPMDEVESRFYIRLIVADRPGVLASIAYAFGDKEVSLASVLQKHSDGQMAEIVLITHRVAEKNLQEALQIIRHLSSVGEVASIIRVVGEN